MIKQGKDLRSHFYFQKKISSWQLLTVEGDGVRVREASWSYFRHPAQRMELGQWR